MKNRKIGRYERMAGYLFLAPAAVMILIFMIIPLIWNVVLAFFEWNGNSKMVFAGFRNFIEIFSTYSTMITFKRSVMLAILSTVVAMLLGIIYALGLYRLRKKEQSVFRFIFFSPSMLPMTVIGLLFIFVLSSEGILNNILGNIGLGNLKHSWLAEPQISLWVIGIIQGWRQSGVVMMLCTAAILGLPNSLFECGKLEGTTYWDEIRLIIIPLVKPTVKLVLSLILLSSFKTYDLVYAMTKGGPAEFTYTAPMKLIQTGFSYNKYGSAAAMGVILTVIVAVFVITTRYVLRGESYEY